jgi:hypothetical protein
MADVLPAQTRLIEGRKERPSVKTWLFGAALGLVLALVSVEISLIGMVLAIAGLVALGLAVPPRYAFLSGGLIGIDGLWLIAALSSVPLACEGSAGACGNPYPMIAVAAALVVGGVIAGLATARARMRLARHAGSTPNVANR